MLRREFLSLPLFAGQRRKRKAAPKPKPVAQSQTPPNLIEKAQLLASFDDERIRIALDCRFLEMWSAEELQAELAAREVRRRIAGD